MGNFDSSWYIAHVIACLSISTFYVFVIVGFTLENVFIYGLGVFIASCMVIALTEVISNKLKEFKRI